MKSVRLKGITKTVEVNKDGTMVKYEGKNAIYIY